jgi:ribonuclease HI
MPRPTIEPPYAQVATPDNNFNTQLVELRITTAVETAKGVGGVKYGKWTAELKFGAARKEISATDAHQTIHTRGAVLAAVAALGALKRRCAVQLYTDSTYLLEGTAWLAMNLALGWHTGKKAGRIRNHAIWGQLRDVASRHDIQWIGPRNLTKGEFGSVMPHFPTEVWRRTVGDGSDTGHLYAGSVLPWDEVLSEYRAFTDDEKSSDVCLNVGNTYDNEATPLTSREREARKRVIARIAKHFQPEYIRPAPPTPSPPVTPTILEPSRVKQLVAAFEELHPTRASDASTGTISFLRYPRADARFRYPTARTARLELEIEQ